MTGASGFIGSNLVDALLIEGHEVIGIDDFSTGKMANLEQASRDSRFTLIRKGRISMTSVLDDIDVQIDGIFHLAASVGVKRVSEHPLDSFLNNVQSMQDVIQFAVKTGTRLVYTSSSEIYGKNQDVPLDENSDMVIGNPPGPRWYYAESKILGESLITGSQVELGLQGSVARLFNTAGPRQVGQFGMVIPSFFKAALTGHPIEIFGTGEQRRSFCHVYDVIDALKIMMSNNAANGHIFNVGGVDSITVGDLAERIKRITNSNSEIRFMGERQYGDVKYLESGNRRPKIEKIESVLGWSPKRSLENILKDYLIFAQNEDTGGSSLVEQ